MSVIFLVLRIIFNYIPCLAFLQNSRFIMQDFVDNPHDRNMFLMDHKVESKVSCAGACDRDVFCLSFYYSKEEKRCLTNTFVLHPSELTQNTQGSFQYFVKEVIKRTRTCSEVKQNDPASVEGHYWLFPEASSLYGNRVRIYCHNMTETTPLEYISLLNPNVGVFPALRNADCTNGVVMSSGHEGTTTFYKVKVMVDSVIIVTNNYDYTFANWTGKRYPYGAAGDCYSPQSSTQKGPCGPVGSFHINFDGTGLRTYGKTSWRSSNDTNISFKASSSSNIKVICGGLCGYCYIRGPGLTLTVNREEMIDQDSAIVVV
ncbi:A disintegrin and metalloproteinase with thrombospondin motifs 9-like [Haliotis cracherodii]|uniref:A disintegrin and metalloproteinase with thrombospondin motifs 9-like n=1 Tax=Haliotis cracherodii TaxID=6455 RepID=UPI0039EAB239